VPILDVTLGRPEVECEGAAEVTVRYELASSLATHNSEAVTMLIENSHCLYSCVCSLLQSMDTGSLVGSVATGMTGATFGTHTHASQAHTHASQATGYRSGMGAPSVGSYTANTVHTREQRYGEEQVVFGGGAHSQAMTDMHQNEEIVISAAMQQLRDPGVLIVAHGSRGKPKTVRLQLTESAVTWRTETRKKGSKDTKPKMGKLHQVPLSHIMYVDVGKQTTALRRVENASVSDALCFSLLTKEGSLDLEANSPRERDALVSCFSLVLDEVHAQNWRDIYRGPSSDMPSSFDELDQQQQAAAAAHGQNPSGMMPGPHNA
jgi:hypothetical protein